MASQLEQLKGHVQSVASKATGASESLANFRRDFSKQKETVSATLGGSSQRKEQEVIASITAADKAVTEAVQALQIAAKTCRDYAASV
jgi:hypothetical protein